MPEANKHNQQYQRNLSLLQEPILNPESSIYLDWSITLMFYTAVHLIELELAVDDIHPVGHPYREKAIARIRKFDPISNEYSTLHMASMKARYDCKRFSKKDAQKYKAMLDKIQNHIESLREASSF